MTVTARITDAEGGVREQALESGGSIAIQPGDRILFPDLAIADAELELVGAHDLAITTPEGAVVLRGLYDLFDIEVDAEIAFGGVDGPTAIDSLGGLLARLTDAAAGVGGGEGFLLDADVGGEIYPALAAAEASPDETDAGAHDGLVYIADRPAPVAAIGGDDPASAALRATELLDLESAPRDIEIDPVAGAPASLDEFDGYFDRGALGGGFRYDAGRLGSAPLDLQQESADAPGLPFDSAEAVDSAPIAYFGEGSTDLSDLDSPIESVDDIWFL